MANHVFQTTPERDYYLLENQDGKTTEVNEETIGDYLEELFDDPEQFVTLTPPKSQNGIRFIQACLDKNKNEGNYVEVELGMEEADGIHLLYKKNKLSYPYQLLPSCPGNSGRLCRLGSRVRLVLFRNFRPRSLP